MFSEKIFEDILVKYPEIIEDNLSFLDRQVAYFGKRVDLLFRDRFNEKLIVELKKDTLNRNALGQVLEYEGYIISEKDPTARVMIVANRIPLNLKTAMDHHGIEWREITLRSLKEFLVTKNDKDFLHLFEQEEPLFQGQKGLSKKDKDPSKKIVNLLTMDTNSIVHQIKSSQNYKSFLRILPMKIKNEEEAKRILKRNFENLKHGHINEIITLIDKPYPYEKDGQLERRPWFGRLLKPNTRNLLNEDVNKINEWFNILRDESIHIERKLTLLLAKPYKISGLNVGFITLMLYILDKDKYLIWFKAQHEALAKVSKGFERYSGAPKQYAYFNENAKAFAMQCGFQHVELDWIFSTGIKVLLL